MQSRNFKPNGPRGPKRRGPGSGYQGGRSNTFNRGRSGGRGRFTGNAIDINKFINKSAGPVAEDKYIAKTLFPEFPIDQRLKTIIAQRGFETPTEIQEKTIPLIMEGKDVIGLANTGTGKTGAFLVPMIDKILRNPHEKLLVVVPTRELAIQIQDEFVAFSKGLHINSVVVVGGANIRPQIDKLRSRHNVVIGTPGRLKDLIQRKRLILDRFANVVLDEADQMLDMGFIPDVRYLLSLVSPKRQTLLFSATLAPEIERLTGEFLNNPEKISIRKRDTSAQVDQDVVRIDRGQDKIEVLHNLLAQTHFQKVLVFSRTKHGAEKLSKALHHKGFKAESIHGDKSHAKRQKALKLFKENIVQILVATDVASRGLDIPNVSHVINFDVPATFEDYIHRIGRTGRAGKTGVALTFVG
ncbi:MAG: DNA/RNA helicase, superfamily II [Candidatus Moranbacteria bacterium GW2011_GWE1_49_15]|nr:MAG: DNA/RNA helicase, superfamily II [Candidatus Moranbacteria bacterium GW2011_GWE1_49_15]